MSPVVSEATIRSIRDQVEIYRDLGILVENAKAALAVLPAAAAQGTAKIHPVVFSGHMIDAPGRSHPRFPPDREEVAWKAIRKNLGEIMAAAKQEDGVEVLGIAGASEGGDLLFHEACHDLGIQTHVLLPVPELVYRATALSRQASRWAERYHAALQKAAKVRTLARSHTSPAGSRRGLSTTLGSGAIAGSCTTPGPQRRRAASPWWRCGTARLVTARAVSPTWSPPVCTGARTW